jgi:hypothetical protein
VSKDRVVKLKSGGQDACLSAVGQFMMGVTGNVIPIEAQHDRAEDK